MNQLVRPPAATSRTEFSTGEESTVFGPLNNRRKPGRVAVIIPTRGRPAIIKGTIECLAQQSRPPDHIYVIASAAADVAELDQNDARLTIRIGRMGSSFQRNDGLALAGERFSYIAFFDDDFIPSRFWIERMSGLFEVNPAVAGVTGLVLADGVTTPGIPIEEAKTIVEQHDSDPSYAIHTRDTFAFGGNLGCNMAFRYSALRGISFDERLPLYAWLEDADFAGRIARAGRIISTDTLWGVHLGHKPGRGRGVTLGYSQIANAVYLARKGTVPVAFLLRGAVRNLLSNMAHSIRPEPFIDRRGRLRGNFIALGDAVRGRIAPERILVL